MNSKYTPARGIRAGLMLWLLCIAVPLSGCGQKGPLILPSAERTAPEQSERPKDADTGARPNE